MTCLFHFTFNRPVNPQSCFHSISRLWPLLTSCTAGPCSSPPLLFSWIVAEASYLFSLCPSSLLLHNLPCQHTVAFNSSHFIVLMDSIGQEFRQTQWSQFFLVLWCLEPQLGWLHRLGLEQEDAGHWGIGKVPSKKKGDELSFSRYLLCTDSVLTTNKNSHFNFFCLLLKLPFAVHMLSCVKDGKSISCMIHWLTGFCRLQSVFNLLLINLQVSLLENLTTSHCSF